MGYPFLYICYIFGSLFDQWFIEETDSENISIQNRQLLLDIKFVVEQPDTAMDRSINQQLRSGIT
jgi:hypothetical protein